MRSTIFSVLSATGAAADPVVWLCGTGFHFADGHIYKQTDMSQKGLGSFPAKVQFPLNMAITNHANESPMDPIMLVEQTSTHNYIEYSQRLYLDKSPNAFEPVGFTADNSSLTGGQTTWGFYGGYGMMFFSDTGNIADIGPKNPDGSTRVVANQGYYWVETGTPGVQQLYWNQTQFEHVRKTGDTRAGNGIFGACHGDYDPVLTPAPSEKQARVSESVQSG